MEEILTAELQAANFCICFLFLLKILSITPQQINTLLAVSPYHRHHLIFSQQTWAGFLLHCLGKSCRSTWKGKFPAQESLKTKASAEGGCFELLAPSAAAALSGLQDRAVGWGTALQVHPDSTKLVQTPTCSLNTTPGLCESSYLKSPTDQEEKPLPFSSCSCPSCFIPKAHTSPADHPSLFHL